MIYSRLLFSCLCIAVLACNNQETYYTQLRKTTDKDAKLFEVQGSYKVVVYYSK